MSGEPDLRTSPSRPFVFSTVSLICTLILLSLWLYEWLDLWANPWLTAWLILAYFAASFALEAVFRESAFCKYVCSLGAFNFVYSTASPLAIRTADADVCRDCLGKECVNGSHTVAGCGTELFVPTIQSNMDCTLCLDCARACPYHNVALVFRAPGRELVSGSAFPKLDGALLAISLAFMGLLNAFGMVPLTYRLQSWLTEITGQTTDAIPLALIVLTGALLLPFAAAAGLSKLGSRFSRAGETLSAAANRYAPGFVPIGMAIWLAHYGFHLAVGGTTIVPVLQSFLLDHGVSLLGNTPNWQVGYLIPAEAIFPLQSLILGLGFSASLIVLACRAPSRNRQGLASMLPWAVLVAALAATALLIFNLPMEMRGSALGSTR